MEEIGEKKGQKVRFRWLVDPVDGTTNFRLGVPHFAVSIAVEDAEARPGGTIVAGLVYQPLTDESFWAEKGKGAWLQDRRLRVSARRDLDDSLIANGIPFMGHGDIARFESIRQEVRTEGTRIRRLRYDASDLGLVAAWWL